MTLRVGPHGKFYGCSNFPKCDCTQGAHQNTGKPRGVPAIKGVRAWRILAHTVFDMIWDDLRLRGRTEAYQWLAAQLKLPKDECHIGRFNVSQCAYTVAYAALEVGDALSKVSDDDKVESVSELGAKIDAALRKAKED